MAERWHERITPIDPDSPIPLYFQVESDLRRLIAADVLHPGETMPPEHDLCATYGVSRHTMRTALARLVADDLIVRTAGRGTLVRIPETRIPFSLDRSFSRQMAELGQTARSVVLRQHPGTVPPDAPDGLRDAAGRPCLDLLRLRLGNDEPVGLQQTIVLTDRCPGLEGFDFTTASLYEVLAGHFRLDIQKIHHTIAAAAADDDQAGRLDVPPGTPLLLVRTTAFLDDHSVIEHTLSHYRSDRYEYEITHTPG